ncbi:metallophosphoesterase family protein [Paenibacillus puerhi]|uniref:metallophosphoesterase family protein n=1 Tax=Paenibacillus puerhi TaxID=2692622 RepID=UPI0013573854|nr:metallophosphoesterase [Paenibacillus puerhi]
MSRRKFLGWLVWLLIWIGAALYGLVKLLEKSISTQEAAKGLEPGGLASQKPSPETGPQGATQADTPLFSFLILSDLHISRDDPDTIRRVKSAFEDMSEFQTPVEALLFTGDLTEYGRDKDYKELRNLMNGYELPPVFANMGNHDYYDIWIDKQGRFKQDTMPNGKTDWQSRERFQQFFGLSKPYHDARVKDHHLILLSQETYVQEKPDVGEGAWYSEEQLTWLEERLAARPDDKPVFIMTHQPLPPAGRDGRTHQVIPAIRFRQILKPHKNVFVFCGHSHQDFQGTIEHYVKESFHYFHNSSVGRVMNRKYETVAQDKAQGMYVQVYADRVTLRGREFIARKWLSEADWTVPLS